MASKAFQWYVSNPEKLRKYAGKHGAIVDDEVVGVGDSAGEAYERAKMKCPKKSSLLAYIYPPSRSWSFEEDFLRA